MVLISSCSNDGSDDTSDDDHRNVVKGNDNDDVNCRRNDGDDIDSEVL